MTAQSQQADDFEAALAAAGRDRPAADNTPVPQGDVGNGRDRSAVPRGRGPLAGSRYDKRNHLTIEERRNDPTRAPRGLVPPEFRGKPVSRQHLADAELAILRRRMDPYAYLVGATAGTVLPPEARLIPCGGNDQHLFYTLGIEDPVLLHNLAVRQGVRAGLYNEWTVPEAPKAKPGASPAAAMAKAAAFLKAHGYRAVPTGYEPNLYAPPDERAGQASVRVNLVENARMAIAFCGYMGENSPPTGPGIWVRVHFPG